MNPPATTALIMAAGQGTRMRSAVPKVLHEVCGRPMIAWPILAAREAGAGRVCVIVSPDRDLSSVLPEGTETIVQPEADGTGGAHARALPSGHDQGRGGRGIHSGIVDAVGLLARARATGWASARSS